MNAVHVKPVGDADYCLVDDDYVCCRISHPTEESQCNLAEEAS